MDEMSSGDESDAGTMSKYMLENICDGSKSCMSINSKEAHYKIHNCIKQRLAECKGALLSTQNMDKGSHKSFKAVVNELLESLPIIGK